jgi:hypothetical protein
MFKASLALKHVSKNVAAYTNIATTSTTQPSNTTPPTSHANLPYPQMPFMPPFVGYGFGMPSIPYSPYPLGNPLSAVVPGMSMPTKSPPSLPPTSNITIAEFCDEYNLGESVAAGLDKLGFRVGDDLASITQQEYTDAGFKPLEWRRLLKAYRKLKCDQRA